MDSQRASEQYTVEQLPRWINSLVDLEPVYESPIDINLTKTIEIQCSPISWFNMEIPPKKMKMTNSGYTLILSAKWQSERPYISDGPLMDKYVFSQLHLHWGKNDGEGSEHTFDRVRYPVEMHVVMFKAHYLTQEAALKEKDGIVVLVYIFQLQESKNPAIQLLIDNIFEIQQAHTSFKLNPVPITLFIKKFVQDYFLYWGSVSTTLCSHFILWLITREPVGISAEQVDELRNMFDENDEPLQGNFREVQLIQGRKVFLVSPSGSRYSTLLPLP